MPKIIQLLIMPNNSRWQGTLLGLADDGAVYECNYNGRWELYIPPIEEISEKPLDKPD